jgi:hypothetical protein
MRTRTLAALLLLSLAATLVAAQQPAQKPGQVYTYVAEWQVPRASWGEVNTNFQKNTRPVLERLSKDGTLTSWGSFETYVHHPDQATHGVWWSSSTLAGIERARSELIRQPTPAAMQQAKHWDYLLRSIAGNGRAGSGTNGFLRVVAVDVQPGKDEDFRQAWENRFKATFDELVANGTVAFYSLDAQLVETENPGRRYFAVVLPNAEALDRAAAAVQAAMARGGPAGMQPLMDTTVAGSRRSYLATVSAYANK